MSLQASPLLIVSAAVLLAGCAGTRSVAVPDAASASCRAAPLGDTVLYLRGSLSSWAALEEYAFQYRCDGYYLNVEASANQEFKLADAAWTPATSFGAAVGGDNTLSDSLPLVLARGSDPGG
ncbi:MAG: hypothetical protein KDI12_23835, partial [Anaerolineae bacterium]|nr:hypothetical protein [Anaerolineae bacterium]